MNEKILKLKEKIEKEIIDIDKLYDKVNNEVTKSYEQKHEKLLLEEKDLKEKLQNEVTKVKEKLEISLSESNRIIRINEKINKGVKKIENEKEKNIIKNLSYASKISKTQKEMKVLLQELMKNIKIAFSKEKNDIQFEEYFFNGIQIPNKIEFKEVSANNFKLFWKIDNIKIENIDNNQIKFKVEIKETNSDEKFTQVYEGNKDNCLIDNLKKNTNYEVRICSVYNNLIGSWSKINEIKTSLIGIDSIILKESQKGEEYLQKIYEWCGYKKMELLYRATRDGPTSDIFHRKCDNQGATICLYKNDKSIFGGYSSISWTNSGGSKPAPNSFLFTLLNIYW